jgi:hypothetical protein
VNTKLLEFLHGNGTDTNGRLLGQMIQWDDERWERTHNFIQWLFPSSQPSQFNAGAPLLDEETIEAIKLDQTALGNIKAAFKRAMIFLRLSVIGNPEKPTWVEQGNHNYLRITRILTFMRTVGLDLEMEFLWFQIAFLFSCFPEEIGETTYQYWEEAAGRASPTATSEDTTG